MPGDCVEAMPLSDRHETEDGRKFRAAAMVATERLARYVEESQRGECWVPGAPETLEQ